MSKSSGLLDGTPSLLKTFFLVRVSLNESLQCLLKFFRFLF